MSSTWELPAVGWLCRVCDIRPCWVPASDLAPAPGGPGSGSHGTFQDSAHQYADPACGATHASPCPVRTPLGRAPLFAAVLSQTISLPLRIGKIFRMPLSNLSNLYNMTHIKYYEITNLSFWQFFKVFLFKVLYSGPYILRARTQPIKYFPNLNVVLKLRNIKIQNIWVVSLIRTVSEDKEFLNEWA